MRSVLIPSVVLLLAACNAPPSAPALHIEPAEPASFEDLSAVLDDPGADPNDDEIVYIWSWSRNGEQVDVDGSVVPASLTRAGEVWSVSVTATDGKAYSETVASADVTVQNTAPTATVVVLPELPLSSQDLTAFAETEDLDGDDVTVAWSWTVDGADAGISTATVPAERTARGETWEVTATPTDAEGLAGEAVTASVVVDNLPPQVTGVELTPLDPTEGSTITAAATGVDPDGDAVSFSYTWHVNGVAVPGLEDASIDGAVFDKGDAVHVEVVANDGLTDSIPLASGAVLIGNTAPTGDSAAITPGEGGVGTLFTCTGSGFTDVDADLVGWHYLWQVDGVTVASGARLSGAGFLARGDRLVCVAIPFDGELEGEGITTDPVIIGNTAPILDSASLTPTAPREGDSVSVVLGPHSDADGDRISFEYAWTVNGSKAGTASTLGSESFAKGDLVACTVTPYDGLDRGAPVAMKGVTVVNSTPRVSSARITPGAAKTDDVLTAVYEAVDPDGDKLSVSYAWTVNGKAAGSGSTLDGSSSFEKGDSVVVTVTVDDGTDRSAPLSSAALVIDNSAPTTPTVDLAPAKPTEDDDLVCVISTPSTDADSGDTVTYDIVWLQDGATYTGSTSTTTVSGDTVPEASTAAGEVWTCEVTAGDGTDDSGVAKASITIGRSSFRAFDGTNNGKWEDMGYPSSDPLYSLQTYGSKDIPELYNMYGSNPKAYDYAKESWRTASSSVPYNSPWTSMAPVGTDLYMVRNNSIYRYDTVGDTWATVTSVTGGDDLNMTESDADGIIYGYVKSGNIVIFDTKKAPGSGNPTYVSTGVGDEHETRMGYDPDTHSVYFGAYNAKNLYRFDIATGKTTSMLSHPESQLNDIFCSDRSGHIYAAGATSGTTMYMYDIAKNTWTKIVDLPSNHGNNGSCAVSEDGYLYVGTGSNRKFYRLGLN